MGSEGFALGQEFGYGRTSQRTLDGDTPAAGAVFSLTLKNYDRQRLVFAAFTLATDANVANRYCTIEYLGGDAVARCADGAAVTVAANTSAQRFVGQLRRGPAEWNTGSDVFFPLCGLWLEAGTVLKINVANIQVGDQLSAIRLTFDRFLDASQQPFGDTPDD